MIDGDMAALPSTLTDSAIAGDPEIRPLRRVEYERLVDEGLLQDERIELLNGRLVRMSPQKDPHASAVEELNSILVPQLQGRARVRVQSPLALDDFSEPEPDVAIIALGRSRGQHPMSALALIEVSDSSVRKDLGEKAEAYARAGIPEYWVVDLPGDRIVVHLEPRAGRYGRITTHARGESIRLAAFPDFALDVAAILG